jgi:hypothetical protein
MADFDKQEYADTFPLELINPRGEKLDAVIIVAGPAHPNRKAFDDKKWRQKARERNRKGKTEIPEDTEELYADMVSAAVAYTVGWENVALGANQGGVFRAGGA